MDIFIWKLCQDNLTLDETYRAFPVTGHCGGMNVSLAYKRH